MVDSDKKNNYKAVGRRKEASARVIIKPGTGLIKVNKRDIKDYFPVETMRMIIEQPLVVCDVKGKIDIDLSLIHI